MLGDAGPPRGTAVSAEAATATTTIATSEGRPAAPRASHDAQDAIGTTVHARRGAGIDVTATAAAETAAATAACQSEISSDAVKIATAIAAPNVHPRRNTSWRRSIRAETEATARSSRGPRWPCRREPPLRATPRTRWAAPWRLTSIKRPTGAGERSDPACVSPAARDTARSHRSRGVGGGRVPDPRPLRGSRQRAGWLRVCGGTATRGGIGKPRRRPRRPRRRRAPRGAPRPSATTARAGRPVPGVHQVWARRARS